MKNRLQTVGRWGETTAVEYLTAKGYVLLEKNVRTPYGELDLIARQMTPPGALNPQDNPVTVFIEVKTRSSTSFGYPEDAVTLEKQARLRSAALAYLQAHPELDGDWRVDVIAIQGSPEIGSPVITHFENVIS